MRKNEAKFTTVFFSEAGTKNKNNDYFGYIQLDNYAIWAVADGFDEEEGADVAARLAVESAIEYFMLHPGFNIEIINEIMSYANLKVREKQTETERYSLMHTSLLIVISNYNALLYGNIGNTRFYHLRNGYVISQSSDDTVAQLLVGEEALNTGDLKYHRQRNDLLQAIGDYGKIKPNILKTPVILQEKDTFCLTTIGFWENIDEKEMEVELSRYDEGKKWLVSLEKKVIATLRDNVENYTFAAVGIEAVAEPLPMEKNNRKFFMKISLVAIASILIILTLTLWQVKKRKDIMNKVTVYEQQAEEELIKKNFENSVKELELVIGEYEKLKPKSRGVIGFFLNADARRKEMDRKIEETKNKIKDTEKLKKGFSDIREGNEFFNNGNYEEASKKYQEAKYSLEQNTYKRDEVNTEEVLSEINSRIEATSKLKEAKNLEITGDTAFTSGNYNLAKENYKMASDIYLANGRADYVSSMEEKIREINEKEKQSYNGALLAENKGDVLSHSDVDMSREAYYQARETYQILGDTVKSQEIDTKIQELNSRQMAKLQTANNMVQEGLNQITSNNPSEALSLLTKARTMYQELKDSNNVNNVDKFINQTQEFIKYESEKEKEFIQQSEQSKLEIQLKEEEIEQERIKREKISRDIESATNFEIQGDQMYVLKRYLESISKYEEAKKIFETLKNEGNFNNQLKLEYLERKIKRSEVFLYEEEGDKESKNKNWKEAEKKYEQAKENIKLSDINIEDEQRIDKKLKKIQKKTNKKWWQFWK
ncbi:tetratricopeptide repeat protein [Leptotrichia sp. oral taxon 215 str. W9775]|uniref:PP2C family protein-serine/threonine phosphatase n=1 Tax=Leptotrichia sp. oral taxon 215 TaxID=712359 RepID=UPI0003ADB97B|nr:protein phosphatase 2C domain-containing protein [Leptotrichia sp. oral taxon 215]ERK65823.1 tetratricopeptide repeat protein [Leptotrichia sp. oral taxon 215 str. W9775]